MSLLEGPSVFLPNMFPLDALKDIYTTQPGKVTKQPTDQSEKSVERRRPVVALLKKAVLFRRSPTR